MVDIVSFVLGGTVTGVLSTLWWVYYIFRRLPRAEKNIEERIVARVPSIIETAKPIIKESFQEDIEKIETKIGETVDNKIDELKQKILNPEDKETYTLAATLLWRFLAAMEEPDIKKTIHAKIIGYTKTYGPQFFEAIKGEATKQYPMLEQIPQGASIEDPNAWLGMIPEEYRETVQGFLPFLQLMKMGKK